MGLGGDPNGTERAVWELSGVKFGWLVHMPASGKWKTTVDIAAHEARENPDPESLDSNPYGVLALPGRRIVADAGANALVEVAADGSTSTLAVFPRRSASPGGPTFQAVPTAVAQGPDGAFYVGQLTGQPFPVGAACVYRVPAGGGTPECQYDRFTNIIDLTFGPDGSLYVLEIDANGLPTPPSDGRLTRIAPSGARAVIQTDPPLVMPGGVAIGPDGAIYVTTGSVFPGGGQVVRIRPPSGATSTNRRRGRPLLRPAWASRFGAPRNPSPRTCAADSVRRRSASPPRSPRQAQPAAPPGSV
jgi:glucose/arabinose dehydrogenase